MRKVLIIGGNGSGKTTMARQLAEITGLPLCHLDTLYWTDDWQPRERSDFITLLQAELEKEEWILDGNMRRTLPQRYSLLFWNAEKASSEPRSIAPGYGR